MKTKANDSNTMSALEIKRFNKIREGKVDEATQAIIRDLIKGVSKSALQIEYGKTERELDDLLYGYLETLDGSQKDPLILDGVIAALLDNIGKLNQGIGQLEMRYKRKFQTATKEGFVVDLEEDATDAPYYPKFLQEARHTLDLLQRLLAQKQGMAAPENKEEGLKRTLVDMLVKVSNKAGRAEQKLDDLQTVDAAPEDVQEGELETDAGEMDDIQSGRSGVGEEL